MYLDGVKIPVVRQTARRYVNSPLAPAPEGLKFSDTRKPSLTNAEMRAVSEWRFGKQHYSQSGERLKFNPATGEYARWGI